MPSPGALLKHPLYATLEPTWRAALDVYEGLGGFLHPDRPYLVPHPREWLDHSVHVAPTADRPASMAPNPSPSQPSPKLLMRRKLARYENLAETIVGQMAGALFLHAPTRTFKDGATDDNIAAWWGNVDGQGEPMGDFIDRAWTTAAVFGHAILALEKGEAADTEADASLPMLRLYTPLDMIDWLTDDIGRLTAVKLLEGVPRETFDTKAVTAKDYRIRTIDADGWALYDHKGAELDSAPHGFGMLPVVVLQGKKRPFTPIVGKSIMGDPQLHIDVYNLTSEVRELLRTQTFGILNVPIGSDQGASVEREQQLIGQQSGTSNVMFSSQPAQFLSPDGGNVQVYHEHLDRLSRMIYRLASAPWESDSREAESAEARGRKRDDQVHVLMKHAERCQSAELACLRLVYRGLYGDRWEKEWEKSSPSIAYSTEFEPPDFKAIASEVSESISLELGETATREFKKRYVRQRLRDLGEDKLKDIDKEIDALVVETEADKRRAMLETATANLGAVGA